MVNLGDVVGSLWRKGRKFIASTALAVSLYGCPTVTPTDDDETVQQDDDDTASTAPRFSEEYNTVVTESVAYEETFSAARADSYTFETTLDSSKYAFDVATGTLQVFNTDDVDVGSYVSMIAATNAAGTSFLDFDLEISNVAEAASMLTPDSLESCVRDESCAVQFEATGDPDPDHLSTVYSLVSGSLPAGMSLSESGVLSGVPTETGTFDFTVRAQGEEDPAKVYVEKEYRLDIESIPVLATVSVQLIDLLTNGPLVSGCGVEVTLDNGITSYTEPVTCFADECTASFYLNETGWFSLIIPPTDTGGTCYDGKEPLNPIEILSGLNELSYGLVPEYFASDVQALIGDQVSMASRIVGYASLFPGRNDLCDTVLDLFQSAFGFNGTLYGGLNKNFSEPIRTGQQPITMDIADFTTAGGVYVQDVFENEVFPYLESVLPYTFQTVPAGTGMISWAPSTVGEWGVNDFDTQSLDNPIITSIEFGHVLGDNRGYLSLATILKHEWGHAFDARHQPGNGFLMNTIPAFEQPGFEETVEKKIFQIKAHTPAGVDILYETTQN